MMDWVNHYNWPKTMSYDARIIMVIGGRDYGKTYGLRWACLNQYLNRKSHPRFIEVCRTKELLKTIRGDYLAKVAREFSGIETRCHGEKLQIRRDDGPWQTCGYLVALTGALSVKQGTYIDVGNIVMDEALIDREVNPYAKYLRNEYRILQNIVDSCTREDVSNKERIIPKLYLLGNAVDFTNPYFDAFRVPIRDLHEYGFRWYAGKNVLLHHVEDNEQLALRKTETLAGIMASITGEDARGAEFHVSNAFVHEKPARAKYLFGIKFESEMYSVWIDWTEGYYFVCDYMPKGDRLVFALTARDNGPNVQLIRCAAPQLQAVAEYYMSGLVFFNSARTREKFLDVLKMLGIR